MKFGENFRGGVGGSQIGREISTFDSNTPITFTLTRLFHKCLCYFSRLDFSTYPCDALGWLLYMLRVLAEDAPAMTYGKPARRTATMTSCQSRKHQKGTSLLPTHHKTERETNNIERKKASIDLSSWKGKRTKTERQRGRDAETKDAMVCKHPPTHIEIQQCKDMEMHLESTKHNKINTSADIPTSIR